MHAIEKRTDEHFLDSDACRGGRKVCAWVLRTAKAGPRCFTRCESSSRHRRQQVARGSSSAPRWKCTFTCRSTAALIRFGGRTRSGVGRFAPCGRVQCRLPQFPPHRGEQRITAVCALLLRRSPVRRATHGRRFRPHRMDRSAEGRHPFAPLRCRGRRPNHITVSRISAAKREAPQPLFRNAIQMLTLGGQWRLGFPSSDRIAFRSFPINNREAISRSVALPAVQARWMARTNA